MHAFDLVHSVHDGNGGTGCGAGLFELFCNFLGLGRAGLFWNDGRAMRMCEVVGKFSLHLPFLLFGTLKKLGLVRVQACLLLQRNMKGHQTIAGVLLLKILNRAAKRVHLRFGILPP